MRNNSVRLRLTQSEAADLRETGRVEETIEFGSSVDKHLIYAIETADTKNVKAEFSGNRITIFIPHTEAAQWLETNQTGIEAVQGIGADKTLKIQLEKDFACLNEREGEDDRDAFPHPQAGKAC